MRRFLGLLAIFVLAALSAAGMASASSNLANGTVLTYTNSGSISLGGVITCNSSTLKATISNNAAGHGINEDITAASFTNCGSGNSITGRNLPWKRTTTGTGPFDWSIVFESVTMLVHLGSSTTCHYRGNPSGGSYSNTTEKLTLAGSLTLQAGSSFLCSFVSPTLNGQYTVSPTLQLS